MRAFIWPLLFLKPDVPLEDPSWKADDQLEFGRLSPYKNRTPAETMLFLGRCVMIFLTLCLGLALAVWTRRHFGAPAAPGALAAGFERDQRGTLYQRLSLRRENQSNSSLRLCVSAVNNLAGLR